MHKTNRQKIPGLTKALCSTLSSKKFRGLQITDRGNSLVNASKSRLTCRRENGLRLRLRLRDNRKRRRSKERRKRQLLRRMKKRKVTTTKSPLERT